MYLRQLDLGLFGGFFQPLQSHAIAADVNALVFLEFGGQPLHDLVVYIVTAQVRIARCRLHLDHPFAHFEHGDVEGAASQVIDGDRFILFLVEPVGQGRGRRLVDDAQHLKPGDLSSLLGRLSLAVVKISRYGNYGLGDLFAQEIFGCALELLQNDGGDFGRTVRLAKNVHAGIVVRPFGDLVRDAARLLGHFVVAAAHETLDGKDGVFGVRDSLALSHLPHQTLPRLGDGHHRGRRARPFLVGDDYRFAALHNGDDGIRRS